MCFTSGAFNITGDQRWNRWGRGREGAKALFTFLPFYFFGKFSIEVQKSEGF